MGLCSPSAAGSPIIHTSNGATLSRLTALDVSNNPDALLHTKSLRPAPSSTTGLQAGGRGGRGGREFNLSSQAFKSSDQQEQENKETGRADA